MNEPNIHYHSLRHRERVIHMYRKDQIEQSSKIIKNCISIGIFVLMIVVEAWIIGNFA